MNTFAPTIEPSAKTVGSTYSSPNDTLGIRYAAVRAQTEHLCEPLDTEDYVVSSMSDVSPTKWHLAHTSWFFETFVLGPHAPEYQSPNPQYAFLFNSYYVQAGERVMSRSTTCRPASVTAERSVDSSRVPRCAKCSSIARMLIPRCTRSSHTLATTPSIRRMR